MLIFSIVTKSAMEGVGVSKVTTTRNIGISSCSITDRQTQISFRVVLIITFFQIVNIDPS